MANANKLKNASTINVAIDNMGRRPVVLEPQQIVRYGKNPNTTYFLNGQKFSLKRDRDYVIGIEPGTSGISPKLTCEDFARAGHGFPDDQTNYKR